MQAIKTTEQMLETEMDKHLGYQKNLEVDNNSKNSLNSYDKKKHMQRLRRKRNICHP